MTVKKKATPKQLAALKKGREKLKHMRAIKKKAMKKKDAKKKVMKKKHVKKKPKHKK
jgi:hypothetical protein